MAVATVVLESCASRDSVVSMCRDLCYDVNSVVITRVKSVFNKKTER